jgi:hypothetical protein
MAIDLDTLSIYLTPLIVFGVYSSLYKENPVYAFIEHAMIGISLAQILVVGWGSINKNLLTPLSEGQFTLLIPIIIGLSYLSIFVRGLEPVYRSIISARIGAMLGLEVGMSITVSITQIIAVAEGVATDLSNILALITMIFILFYFTFSRATDRVFSIPRKISRWFIFLFFAANVATLYGTRLDAFVGWMFTIALSPGVVIIPIVAVIILIDVLVGWRKILGLKEVTAETE